MKNLENILNGLVAKLLSDGTAEFSQDGLNIKASYNDGCFSLKTSFVEPVKDDTKELIDTFEKYVKSLNDDFFIEVVETFKPGQLKAIQDKLDSKNPKLVVSGINEFMQRLKEIASDKVDALNKDIAEAEKEMSDLIEIRDSYVHVLNKKF